MYSTGEVCIVPPVPLSDPDALSLTEINMGSTLLDMDLIQHQQRQARYDGPSPTPFGGGFGLPPSPDMQVSFYQDQNAFPAQQMGSSIQQMGMDQTAEIQEDEMARLVMRMIIPDIIEDCHKHNLVPNPYCWTAEEVQKWLACVVRRLELGDIEMRNFYMNGPMLASLQDEDFRQRAPKCGDILYSVVSVLLSTLQYDAASQVVPQAPTVVPSIPQPSHFGTALHTDMGMPPRYINAPISPVATPGDESGSTGSPSDDEISIPSPAPSGPNTSMTPNHTGGIQLWQFLKELLLQPNSYSYCIRWMDRSQGIFKIEDSVEVARLWGLRKNRPAMNYDKLSRSIRQYYRKGIMKKTEVSQRLVYQFVHPC
ncbi:SAM pointed domain-containing Ets transcription factor-like [Lytechinus pictus]|uniref:SAM pointed domain-containing Ets transcription factor-like n=1 Tax=Lytechinus pictus TaxID=7653 RepID=UPI0030BA0B05